MLNKGLAGFLPVRALPPRNERISINGPQALSLRGQVWFTPEVVIWDAIYVLTDLFLLWRLFRNTVKLFAARAAIIAIIIFAVFGLSRMPQKVAANIPENPTAKISAENTPLQISSQITSLPAPIFAWPVPKTYISTYFSSFHKGIDIPEPYGTPVKPVAAGEVVFAGWDANGFGNSVIINHNDGYRSRYSHLSSISVNVGAKINSDVTIGRIGATGVATGPHLHLEIYQNDYAINPLNLLP
jgi:murein DD-endopeptidase MepM/ murein hydrolase activator NlpD